MRPSDVKAFPGRTDRRGSNGQSAVRVQAGVRHPSDVPQLKKDQSPFAMDGVDHLLPAGGLFSGMDSRERRDSPVLEAKSASLR